MKERTAERLAWLAFGLITALFVAGLALSFVSRTAVGEGTGPSSSEEMLFLAAMFSFPVVGVLIASRQPRNTIAWIFLAIGLAWNNPVGSYAYYGLVAKPGAVPLADLAAALSQSRKRLVTAQDQERRRIERDLHDGAQQYLVALKTRLSLAKKLGERDPSQALGLLSGLEELAGETLDTLRHLARGIYPPLLADQGLKAALEAQARKARAQQER